MTSSPSATETPVAKSTKLGENQSAPGSAGTLPAQSAHFQLPLDDELLATARWPRWPGVVLLGAPALFTAYAFGFGGATVEGFLHKSGILIESLREAIAAQPVFGFLTALIVGTLSVALYGGMASLVNTPRVFFAQNMVIVETRPLPFFRRRKSYALSDLISAGARGHGRLNGRHDAFDFLLNKQYALVFRMRKQREETALWNLGEKEHAKRVARAINARIDAANEAKSATNAAEDSARLSTDASASGGA